MATQHFCKVCGAPIVLSGHGRHKEYCSMACRKKFARSKPRSGRDNFIKSFDPISAERLASAATKPNGCSDVRWRMELSRRAMMKRAGRAMPLPFDNPQSFQFYK